MNTNEFLKATEKYTLEEELDVRIYRRPRPRVVCKDGFSISIQANQLAYCYPRSNSADRYQQVELGYPNIPDKLILEYAEEPLRPLNTVYGYVPVTIVDQLLEKHGGIDRW